MADRYFYRDVVLVTVSYDADEEELRAFLDENEYRFRVLVDDRDKGITGPLYQVGPIPTLLLINSEGRITYRHVGYSPGDEEELQTQIDLALGTPQT